jgi:hypothetical protein
MATSVARVPPARGRGMSILDDALERIPAEVRAVRRVARVRLTGYFTLVQLDDGSVGAGMSYYRLDAAESRQLARQLEEAAASDPLLLEDLRGPSASDRVALSLRTAVLSALCRSATSSSLAPAQGFEVHERPPFDFFAGASRVVVVGFGGLAVEAAGRASVKRLEIADLTYAMQRTRIEATLDSWRQARPDLDVTAWNGSEIWRAFRRADLICITGSALCNGTMDRLLWDAAGCACVVVEGQSAGVHPLAFFDRGVDLVATTLKPAELLDVEVARVQDLLEGGLPFVYLGPTVRASDDRSLRWFGMAASRAAGQSAALSPAHHRMLLRLVDRPGEVLHLGCGDGTLLRFLCRHSEHRLVPAGIDQDPAAIERARYSVFPEFAARFLCGDPTRPPFPDASQAVVVADPAAATRDLDVAGGALERFVQRVLELVAPGGRAVFHFARAQLAACDAALGRVLRGRPHQRVTLAGDSTTFIAVERDLDEGPGVAP